MAALPSVARSILCSLALFIVLATGAACGTPPPVAGLNASSSLTNADIASQERFLAAWHLSPYNPDRDGYPHSASFSRYFEAVGFLDLPDSILIGEISSLEVAPASSNLLVVDHHSSAVHVLDAQDRKWRRLEAESCHPGFVFRPFNAAFDGAGRIVTGSNAAASGFLFTDAGECDGAIDIGFGPPNDLSGNKNGAVVYRAGRDSYTVAQIAYADGTTQTFFEDDSFVALNSRFRLVHHLARTVDRRFAFVQPQSPKVRMLSPSDSSVVEIGSAPNYYRPIEKDISSAYLDTEDFFDELREIREGKSFTSAVYSLGDSILAVFYTNGYETFERSEKSMGLQLIDLNGATLNDEPILMRGYRSGFVGAAHGLLFRVAAEYENDFEYSNAPIAVYRLRREPPGATADSLGSKRFSG